MRNTSTDIPWTEAADLAVSRGVMGVGLAVTAVLVVGLLVGFFAFGSKRVREDDSPRPRPDEQPRVPEGGPVGEILEQREPDGMPKSDDRLTPYDLHGGNSGSRPAASRQRPRRK